MSRYHSIGLLSDMAHPSIMRNRVNLLHRPNKLSSTDSLWTLNRCSQQDFPHEILKMSAETIRFVYSAFSKQTKVTFTTQLTKKVQTFFDRLIAHYDQQKHQQNCKIIGLLKALSESQIIMLTDSNIADLVIKIMQKISKPPIFLRLFKQSLSKGAKTFNFQQYKNILRQDSNNQIGKQFNNLSIEEKLSLQLTFTNQQNSKQLLNQIRRVLSLHPYQFLLSTVVDDVRGNKLSAQITQKLVSGALWQSGILHPFHLREQSIIQLFRKQPVSTVIQFLTNVCFKFEQNATKSKCTLRIIDELTRTDRQAQADARTPPQRRIDNFLQLFKLCKKMFESEHLPVVQSFYKQEVKTNLSHYFGKCFVFAVETYASSNALIQNVPIRNFYSTKDLVAFFQKIILWVEQKQIQEDVLKSILDLAEILFYEPESANLRDPNGEISQLVFTVIKKIAVPPLSIFMILGSWKKVIKDCQSTVKECIRKFLNNYLNSSDFLRLYGFKLNPQLRPLVIEQIQFYLNENKEFFKDLQTITSMKDPKAIKINQIIQKIELLLNLKAQPADEKFYHMLYDMFMKYLHLLPAMKNIRIQLLRKNILATFPQQTINHCYHLLQLYSKALILFQLKPQFYCYSNFTSLPQSQSIILNEFIKQAYSLSNIFFMKRSSNVFSNDVYQEYTNLIEHMLNSPMPKMLNHQKQIEKNESALSAVNNAVQQLLHCYGNIASMNENIVAAVEENTIAINIARLLKKIILSDKISTLKYFCIAAHIGTANSNTNPIFKQSQQNGRCTAFITQFHKQYKGAYGQIIHQLFKFAQLSDENEQVSQVVLDTILFTPAIIQGNEAQRLQFQSRIYKVYLQQLQQITQCCIQKPSSLNMKWINEICFLKLILVKFLSMRGQKNKKIIYSNTTRTRATTSNDIVEGLFEIGFLPEQIELAIASRSFQTLEQAQTWMRDNQDGLQYDLIAKDNIKANVKPEILHEHFQKKVSFIMKIWMNALLTQLLNSTEFTHVPSLRVLFFQFTFHLRKQQNRENNFNKLALKLYTNLKESTTTPNAFRTIICLIQDIITQTGKILTQFYSCQIHTLILSKVTQQNTSQVFKLIADVLPVYNNNAPQQMQEYLCYLLDLLLKWGGSVRKCDIKSILSKAIAGSKNKIIMNRVMTIMNQLQPIKASESIGIMCEILKSDKEFVAANFQLELKMLALANRHWKKGEAVILDTQAFAVLFAKYQKDIAVMESPCVKMCLKKSNKLLVYEIDNPAQQNQTYSGTKDKFITYQLKQDQRSIIDILIREIISAQDKNKQEQRITSLHKILFMYKLLIPYALTSTNNSLKITILQWLLTKSTHFSNSKYELLVFLSLKCNLPQQRGFNTGQYVSAKILCHLIAQQRSIQQVLSALYMLQVRQHAELCQVRIHDKSFNDMLRSALSTPMTEQLSRALCLYVYIVEKKKIYDGLKGIYQFPQKQPCIDAQFLYLNDYVSAQAQSSVKAVQPKYDMELQENERVDDENVEDPQDYIREMLFRRQQRGLDIRQEVQQETGELLKRHLEQQPQIEINFTPMKAGHVRSPQIPPLQGSLLEIIEVFDKLWSRQLVVVEAMEIQAQIRIPESKFLLAPGFVLDIEVKNINLPILCPPNKVSVIDRRISQFVKYWRCKANEQVPQPFQQRGNALLEGMLENANSSYLSALFRYEMRMGSNANQSDQRVRSQQQNLRLGEVFSLLQQYNGNSSNVQSVPRAVEAPVEQEQNSIESDQERDQWVGFDPNQQALQNAEIIEEDEEDIFQHQANYFAQGRQEIPARQGQEEWALFNQGTVPPYWNSQINQPVQPQNRAVNEQIAQQFREVEILLSQQIAPAVQNAINNMQSQIIRQQPIIQPQQIQQIQSHQPQQVAIRQPQQIAQVPIVQVPVRQRQILSAFGLPQSFLADANVDAQLFDLLPEDLQMQQLNAIMQQQQRNRNNSNSQPVNPDDLQNQNVAFLVSLDPATRRQVLSQATPQFLMTLPISLRAEAQNIISEQISRIASEEQPRYRSHVPIVYPDIPTDKYPQIAPATACHLLWHCLLNKWSWGLQLLLENKKTQPMMVSTLLALLRKTESEVQRMFQAQQNIYFLAQKQGCGVKDIKSRVLVILQSFIHLTPCKDKQFLLQRVPKRNYFTHPDEQCEGQQQVLPLIQLLKQSLEQANPYSKLPIQLIGLITKQIQLPVQLLKIIINCIRDNKLPNGFYQKMSPLSNSAVLKQLFLHQFPQEDPPRIQILGKILKYEFCRVPYLKKLHLDLLSKSDPKYYFFFNAIFVIYTEQSLREVEQSLVGYKAVHGEVIKYLYKNKVTNIHNQPIAILFKSCKLLDFQTKKFIFCNHPRLRKSGRHRMHIKVRREHIFHDSYEQVMGCTLRELEGRMHVTFDKEPAHDAGGVARQWFICLSKEIFNPQYGLFEKSSSGVTYQPNPRSYVNPNHLNYFKFLGRILGKALIEHQLIDAYFTRAFYKLILGQPLDFQDLEQQDLEFYRSMVWQKNNPLDPDTTFSYDFDHFGKIVVKELKPGGKDIAVTEENKIEYIEKYCLSKMRDAFAEQVQKFLEGLHELVPAECICFFEAKQLQLLISGLPFIDLQDLKQNVQLSQYSPQDPSIKWFWQILNEYTQEQLAKLIQFITGTSRVPSGGFAALVGMNGLQRISIHKDPNPLQLPKSHTCFNQLDLPVYASKELLKAKLRVCIEYGSQGFGFM